jgi:hypothetical protein
MVLGGGERGGGGRAPAGHPCLRHCSYAFVHKARNLIQQDMNLESLKVKSVLTNKLCLSMNKVLNSMMLLLGI